MPQKITTTHDREEREILVVRYKSLIPKRNRVVIRKRSRIKYGIILADHSRYSFRTIPHNNDNETIYDVLKRSFKRERKNALLRKVTTYDQVQKTTPKDLLAYKTKRIITARNAFINDVWTGYSEDDVTRDYRLAQMQHQRISRERANQLAMEDRNAAAREKRKSIKRLERIDDLIKKLEAEGNEEILAILRNHDE